MGGRFPLRRDSREIAIVGMACLFPQARNLSDYWKNIVTGHDAIEEVPAAQFEAQRYYDPQSEKFEKIYCRRGGFINDLVDFDPLAYGIMPNAVSGSDPDQFLAIKVAVDALSDAGYADKEFNRRKSEVVIGRTSAPGVGALGLIQRGQGIEQVLSVVKEQFPNCSAPELQALAQKLQENLPPCNADTIPGVMPNVLAGRIAGRLGFGGRNLILDAACASSLVALEICVKDLLSGDCDLALAGGIHVNSNVFFYQMFCGIGALSYRQQISPFSAHADGTLLGDGVAMVVLKRKQDALRDGDRIYASILGIGTSSDGGGTSMLAPSIDGEALAMKRAYDMAGVSPRTIGLLEAHGTATPIGDAAEMEAVARVFGKDKQPWCALGSVKSMIGHTQAASGMAGLIKSALALYHGVLPPTLHAEEPNPKINWAESPCYLNTRSRPWVNAAYKGESPHPRRAAVSAFGFGGVNAHVVLEEAFTDSGLQQENLLRQWDTELCLLRGNDVAGLLSAVAELRSFLQLHNSSLKDIAYTLSKKAAVYTTPGVIAALVVSSTAELAEKLEVFAWHLQQNANEALDGQKHDCTGIYYQPPGDKQSGQLAFVLSGLGAAYPNMLSELCIHFPEIRAVFDTVDQLSLTVGDSVLPSNVIFPRINSTDNAFGTAALASMDSAVVTVLLIEYALHTLLKNLQITPDALIGCSTGEFAGVVMGGAVDVFKAVELFYSLSLKVARAIPRESFLQLSSMRVDASYAKVAPLIRKGKDPVYLTADLAPDHIVITGSRAAIKGAGALLKEQGVECHVLPIAIPYHTPLVEGVVDAGQEEIQNLPMSAPVIPTWSCSTGELYPNDVDKIRAICTELFTKPICLRQTIERAYESGVRTFVEVGPRGGLIKLIKDTLQDKPHVAVATDVANRGSIAQLNHMLAALAVNDVTMNLDYLFKYRQVQQLNFQKSPPAGLSKTQIKLSLSYPELKSGETVMSLPASQAIPVSAPDAEEPAAAGEVISGYLSSLGDFHQQMMKAQQEVMSAFLHSAEPAVADLQLPFLRDAEIDLRDDACVVKRTLHLQEDRYLLSHAIGAEISCIGEQAQRVYLLPLMVALEIMAEAASLLEPGQVVIRLENVRAQRRIRVGKRGFQLVARALRTASGIQVELVEQESAAAPVLMECQVIFAGSYPPAPRLKPLVLSQKRQPRIKPGNLYGPDTMFHGPAMQAVLQLDAVGQEGTIGKVRRRLPYDWFGSDLAFEKTAAFLIDPLLLDNASQLVLYHLFEQEQPVSALLPFLIESIEFFAGPSAIETIVDVQAKLSAVTSRGTVAQVQVADDSGKLLVRINEIRSRAIMLPKFCKTLVDNGREALPGDDLSHLFQDDGNETVAAIAVKAEACPDDEGTLDWLTDYVLSEHEAAIWNEKLRAEKRKNQWLMGRLAAKQAVQLLLWKAKQIKICLADINIGSDADQSPLVVLPEALGFTEPVNVSIAHCEGLALAMAAFSNEFMVGVDVEIIAGHDQDFEEMSFSAPERLLFADLNGHERDEFVTRLWCAKEALIKALKMDLMSGLKTLHCQKSNLAEDGQLVLTRGTETYKVNCLVQDGYVLSAVVVKAKVLQAL